MRPIDMVDRRGEEAKIVVVSMVVAPRSVVIGSTSFWGVHSRQLCELNAGDLARMDQFVALAGGMDGVGVTFGKSIAVARKEASLPENLFPLLPRRLGPCDCDVTLGVGIDLHDRLEIPGPVGHVCLVIEVGPDTEYESTVGTTRKIPVIPLGRTGESAGNTHSELTCPKRAEKTDWALFSDVMASHSKVTAGVRRLFQSGASTQNQGNSRNGDPVPGIGMRYRQVPVTQVVWLRHGLLSPC